MQLTINIGKEELMNGLLIGGVSACCIYIYNYIKENKEIKRKLKILNESDKRVKIW